MFNPFKSFVRRTLWKLGFRLYTRSSLPYGNMLQKDIEDETGVDSIRLIFDVGANVGQQAFVFREAFPQSEIYSFEPIPHIYDQFVANHKGDARIYPFKLALGEAPKAEVVYLQSNNRCNSLSDKINKPDAKMGGESVDVQVVTLDNFCAEKAIEHIDILKLDTEGFDMHVLRGAERMLAERRITYIYVEVSFNADASVQYTPFEEVHEFLKERGFRLRSLFDQSSYDRPYMYHTDALFLLQEN